MQMASQVYHIETAANALCFFRDGEAAYLTRRLDVAPGGSNYQQEDLASLAGLTKVNGGSDYKYSHLSYEECAELIRRYTVAASVEVLKFFRIVVFNYLILNDDAHLKNFSLINRGDGEYHLAPAYDLTGSDFPSADPWSSHGGLHQMSVCGKFSGIGEDDLLRVADRFGIGTAAAVLERVRESVAALRARHS